MFVCLTAVSLISTCPCVTQRRSQSWLLELLVVPICYNDRQIVDTETRSRTNNALTETLLILPTSRRLEATRSLNSLRTLEQSL